MGAPPVEVIAYGDGPDQVADIHRPDPVRATGITVVYLHGGFWFPEVDRRHASGFVDALARTGHLAVNLEYGRPQIRRWETIRADVARGLQRVLALPETGGRCVVVGHSAGGQIAATLADGHPGVDGVVTLAGCVNLGLVSAHGLGGGAADQLVAGLAEADVRDADPMNHVPARVPVCVVHSPADGVIPMDIGTSYAAAAGVLATAVELRGVGHGEMIDPRSAAFRTVLAAISGENYLD